MTEQSASLHLLSLWFFRQRDCLVPIGATNPIPNYLEPEPKAVRKVDCHQCSFLFVSGKGHYGTPNLSAIFHYLHSPY